MTTVPSAHGRYRAYAGFVTTPQYFDDSPQLFLPVAPPGHRHPPAGQPHQRLRARPAGRQCRPVGRVGHLPGRSFCDEDEKLRIEDDTLWDYPNHLMVAAVNAHQRAPEADAVVQTGAGFRMMQVVDTVEGQIGKPVVASDFALYWALLRHLGLQAAPGCGHLLSTPES